MQRSALAVSEEDEWFTGTINAGRHKVLASEAYLMPDLDACYFCGDIGGVTRQTPVPEAIIPPDTSVPTVALCPACADRLQQIFSPLEDTQSDTGPQEAGTSITIEPTEDPTSADGSTAEEGSHTEPNQSDQAGGLADSTDSPVGDERPEGYGKVLRFLRNRELPVERDTVVELATTAYDLRREQVAEALEYAVATGALVEADGKLQRP